MLDTGRLVALAEALRFRYPDGSVLCLDASSEIESQSATIARLEAERDGIKSRLHAVEDAYEQLRDHDAGVMAELRDELERVRGERDRHRDELENIANANPSTWESPSDFAAWARNRARHSLSGGSARYPALAARENEDSNG
jgi:hypothetical protein